MNLMKFEFFGVLYYRKDRNRVIKYYKALLKKTRDQREKPREEVVAEYFDERNKYAIGTSAYGKSKGHKLYIYLNKLIGNYVKNRMYMHDHYFDSPFFMG